MKTKIFKIAILLMTFSGIFTGSEASAINNTDKQDSMSVYCSPDLYPLTSAWIREYTTLNPSSKIRLQNLRADNVSELETENSLAFISSGFYFRMADKSGWKETIGREVTVPVFNRKNPFIKEIMSQGISPAELSKVFASGDNRGWATLLENGQSTQAGLYLLNLQSSKYSLAKFLGTEPEKLTAIEVETPQQLISAIQEDIYSIGICRLSDVINPETFQMPENIGFLPIDKNGNGKLDSNEMISEKPADFNRAVWIGKFPKSLTGNIYSFASTKPSGEKEIALLKWVLSDGQKLTLQNGYCELALAERQTKISDLNPTPVILSESGNNFAMLKLILLIIVAFTISAVLIEVLIRYRKNLKEKTVRASSVFQDVLNEHSVNVLNGLYYDRTHTWAFMEKDGLVKVGVGDFLQHITGTVTQLKLKSHGDKVLKCEPAFSVVHEGKQITINSPVSGIIREINPDLVGNFSLVNSSPYTDGWVYRIEPSNWMRDIPFLFMGDKYRIWLKDEFSRLKDFLTTVFKGDSPSLETVILQDGGELKDFPLADLSPEVWEEFQTKFIDTSR